MQSPTDLKPILARERPIQDDQVGARLLCQDERGRTVEPLQHTVALVVEVATYQRIQLSFGFNYQALKPSDDVVVT